METESVRSHASERSSKSKPRSSSKHGSLSSNRHMGRSSNSLQYEDENWGETQTHITSEQSISVEDLSPGAGRPLGLEPWDANEDRSLLFMCQRYLGFLATAALALAALASPLAMAVLPKLGLVGDTSAAPGSKLLACKADCKGSILALSLKTAILGVAIWVLLMRRPRATMPRIFALRALLLSLLTVVLLSFWLFYLASLAPGRTEYAALVSFANSLADTLNFTLWLAVVLLEVRQLQPAFCIKVVRSPDGESQCYSVGQLSIQRAAVWVLDQYYATFPVYNPYLETMPLSKKNNANRSKNNAQNNTNNSEYKYYDVDNSTVNQILTPGSRGSGRHRRDSSHNERFYEQTEYERRVRKRKARLEVAAEEAFTHIRRLQTGGTSNQPLDSDEAAQAIFPTLARALQKFLRVTRQQPQHSFEREQRAVQNWALVCPELLSRDVRHGLRFVLRQGDVTLSCTVSQLPHYSLTEQLLPATANRFALRLNSETSV
ncbi:UNVERIFIED_CONTAM: hypothetical protein B566_EDAN019451 [Ephemera danica]|nr:hypothetical protein B566_EDAN019451 [Ephemera danica]